MKFKVELVYDAEYNGYVAECPSLPGCMSQGKTVSETMANIREAITGYLKAAKQKHLKIPQEMYSTHFVTV